ncbi:MAG: hypothetical protein JW881_02170 [Spirochaetales bacterium]|nr:hypothetical protein [Spirochaetales bacterium]
MIQENCLDRKGTGWPVFLYRVYRFISGIFFVIIVTSGLGCGPFQHVRDDADIDICPPLFLELITNEPDKVRLVFDEPVHVDTESVSLDHGLSVKEIGSVNTDIIFTIEDQMAGKEYCLDARFEDDYGNSVHLIIRFYGYNPSLPHLIINEFITEGSKTHPDLVELKVLEAGNMGGIVFYEGTPSFWEHRLVFPAFSVGKGDFILIHMKPEGLETEIDESGDKGLSGGLDASATAFDFWVRDGDGIANSNGVITLYSSPGGDILDGVLYSSRNSSSDERYLGFGTRKVMEWVMELQIHEGWKGREESIRPEDGVDPTDSTTTRSICRDKNGVDSDTSSDWHIVPTRMSSFGEDNCEERYGG